IASLPEPWFLYVSYHAPHTPLHNPPQGLCPPDTTCPGGFCANLGPGSTGVEQLKAMVEVMDDQLGRLLEAVDPEDTYVLFVGDNGTTAMGTEAPFSSSEAKGSVYQGGVNVPLIVRGPDVVVGETAAPVGVVDFLATIGDLTGTGLAADDSVSFGAVLFDPAERPRSTLYAETFGPNGASLPIAMHDYALRDERSSCWYKPLYQTSCTTWRSTLTRTRTYSRPRRRRSRRPTSGCAPKSASFTRGSTSRPPPTPSPCPPAVYSS
ncbi:MAG: sulfatase-like hydrolase/transferase, partial [Planctomycetota bacterium]